MLARELGEYGYPQPTHRLTVDTYAVQHPGVPGRRQIQSVSAHLVSLHLALERGLAGPAATHALDALTRLADRLVWLEPPVPNGRVTVLDVARATGLAEHCRAVEAWTRDVWSTWSAHHPAVRALAAEALGERAR